MYKKFQPLDYSRGWDDYWRDHPQGYSPQEQMINWSGQLNAMIDFFNEYFDVDLSEYTTDVLEGWYFDGRLEDIINEALFNSKADKTTVNSLIDTVAEIKDMAMNIKMLGAKGDGVTDDTAAFTNTLAFMKINNLHRLRVPAGHYKFSSEIVIDESIMLETDGVNTIFDFSEGTFVTGICLNVKGEGLEELPLLASDVPEYSSSATFVTPPALSVNDVLLVYNPTDSSFSSYQPYYRQGEYVTVKAISGSVVVFDTPLYADYTIASGSRFYKVKTNTTVIDGLTIIAHPDCIGMRFEYGYHSSIKNVIVKGTKEINVQLYKCFECSIDAINVRDYTPIVDNNYGVAVSNCQSINISNCHLKTVRHGISIGGAGYLGDIPNRKININNCNIGGITNVGGGQGADIHGNSEFITFSNCFIENGMDLAGDHITVKDCIIRQNGTGNNHLYTSEINGCDWTLENLTLIFTTDTTINNITFAPNANTRRAGRIALKNIKMIDANNVTTFAKIKIVIVNNDSNVTPDVLIEGCSFETTEAATDNYLRLEGVGVGRFNDITIQNNRLKNVRVYLRQVDAPHIIFKDNTVDGNYIGDGFAVEKKAITALTEQLIEVHNNKFFKNGYCGVGISGADKTFTIIDVVNNKIFDGFSLNAGGSSSNKANMLLTNAKLMNLKDNILGDRRTVPQQVRLYTLSEIETLFEQGNKIIGTITSVSLTTITNHYTNPWTVET